VISDDQHRALAARTLTCGRARDRFTAGVRDAANALRDLLEAHIGDRDALEAALRGYLALGPARGDADYERGGECVHSDVEEVLDGDPYTIIELLATLKPEGRP